MRIISKFRDYYDSTLAYGHDKDTVFLRTTTKLFEYPDFPEGGYKIEPTIQLTRHKKKWRTKLDRLGINKVWVGIAGKCYTGLNFIEGVYNGKFLEGEVCWTAEKAEAAVLKRLSAGKLPETWEDEEQEWYGGSYYMNRASLTKFFDRCSCRDLPQGFFLKHNSPIWKYPAGPAEKVPGSDHYQHPTELNPCLQDISFFQALSAPQAFQNISMYLSSVLLKSPPSIIKIVDDKILAAKAGFDETSFRNISPGPRKARRSHKST